jgi:glycosyltransferase involved in cell wall biosynthesis
MPLLTIVASNRNRLKLNDNASKWFLKSIQWQSCKEFTLLISDGGSDNYEELKEYFKQDSAIHMDIVQHKIGDAFLRAFLNNFGIRNAKTPYICCTDCDIVFGKDLVKTLIENLDEKSFVESKTMYWKDKIAKKIYSGELDPYNDLESCKRGRTKNKTTAGSIQATHINNWKRLRSYNEAYEGWGSEDFDLLTRATLMGFNIKWLGESKENLMVFHQPHEKNTKRDLIFQEKNKVLLEKTMTDGGITMYQVVIGSKPLKVIDKFDINPNGWGGVKDY